MVAPALIGAAGSILGGLFGRSKQISAGDNAYSHVAGIMRAAKKFGWNPMTLLGGVSPMGGTPADNTSFGQGIANAAMIWSDSLASRASEKAKLNQYQMQNDRLQERLTALTLRPPVPGIFGGGPQNETGQVPVDFPVDPRTGAALVGPSGAPDPSLTPVDTTYVAGNGEEIKLPEGVDLEDVGTGWLLNKWGQMRTQFTPWASSLPAVRREFFRDNWRAMRGPQNAEPSGGLKPTDSRMPSKTPWWMLPQEEIDRAAKARRVYEWPQRPGAPSLRWQ